VVLDEVQRLPGVFEVLRVLVDRPGAPARFLVLGSASPDLLRQGSETLAGRIVYHELRGLALDELQPTDLGTRWLRGGFPRAYLAPSTSASARWRAAFVRTFLERDLRSLGIDVAPEAMRRFWTMLAHYHGQTWNGSEFARSFGVSDKTVRRYLDHLSHALVVTLLPPWFENLAKRQVRSPRVYVSDSGLLHTLLGLETMGDLEGHPKVGASWEGFLLEQVVERLGAAREQCFTWSTYSGAELDLLVVSGRRRLGFEFKRTLQPAVTKSMRVAIEDLQLDQLDVVHAGEHTFPLGERVRAVAAADLTSAVQPL
jgi:hypothetical protein